MASQSHSYHSEDSRVLGALCQKPGTKIIIIPRVFDHNFINSKRTIRVKRCWHVTRIPFSHRQLVQSIIYLRIFTWSINLQKNAQHFYLIRGEIQTKLYFYQCTHHRMTKMKTHSVVGTNWDLLYPLYIASSRVN